MVEKIKLEGGGDIYIGDETLQHTIDNTKKIKNVI